jgi:hypothetical protein
VYGFLEQLLHYFDRPHVGVPTRPIGGPAAWRGDELAGSDAWRERLTGEQVAELARAVDVARACGRPTAQLTAADFPLPKLAEAIARWRHELVDGRGFLLVGGLPVASWSREEAEVAFWGLGLHLGVPGAQNEEGDLLGRVIDLSAEARHADERLYRTNKSIRFHCDAADVVGLLCLGTSREGGASRLVSSVTVFDHLLATRPELAARLFEPMLLDARRPPGAGTQYTPVPPCTFDGTRLRTFMHLDYYTSVERHPGVTLDERARAVLAAWEEYAEQPGVHLDMQLAPGDVQLVSNHSVVHARTAYADEPGAPPRHLLRLWLSLEQVPAAAGLTAPAAR